MDETTNTELVGKVFSIVHLNFRSIVNKIESLQIYMNDLTPDIFAVTETWLHALLPSNLLTLNGYHLVRLDRQPIDGVTKKGGGVAMYINELNSYSTDEYNIYNLSNQDIEILCISVKNIHQHKLVIGVTYRPPQGNPTNFCDIINGTVKDMNLDDNVDLFLVGDLSRGGPGGPDPPLLGHDVGFLTLGPKLDPLLDPPPPFFCLYT